MIKSYSHLDLNRPMFGCRFERKRHLLLEGDLKLKDSNTSKASISEFLLVKLNGSYLDGSPLLSFDGHSVDLQAV